MNIYISHYVGLYLFFLLQSNKILTTSSLNHGFTDTWSQIKRNSFHFYFYDVYSNFMFVQHRLCIERINFANKNNRSLADTQISIKNSNSFCNVCFCVETYRYSFKHLIINNLQQNYADH